MRSARGLRINYFAHCVDGALFMGGLSFVNPHTVLPRMFEALGAPSFLIALALLDWGTDRARRGRDGAPRARRLPRRARLRLVVSKTLGSLAGFLAGGFSGDRHGEKVSVVVAHAGLLVLVVRAPFAASEGEFLGLFALFGFALSLATVGATTLDLDIAPPGGDGPTRRCSACSRSPGYCSRR